eukprot:CFRG1229T1
MIHPIVIPGWDRPFNVWDYWLLNVCFAAMYSGPILTKMYSNAPPHLEWDAWIRHVTIFVVMGFTISWVYFMGSLPAAGHTRLLVVFPALFVTATITSSFIQREETFWLVIYGGSFGFISVLRMLGFAFGYGPLKPLTNRGIRTFFIAAGLPVNIVSPPQCAPPTSSNDTAMESACKKVERHGTEDGKRRDPTTDNTNTTACPKEGKNIPIKRISLIGLVKVVVLKTVILAALYFLCEYSPYKGYNDEYQVLTIPLFGYLGLSALSDTLGGVAALIWDFGIGPSFDEPYASEALCDFWGRRWCLFTQRTLRETVFVPCTEFLEDITGRAIAKLVATMATFCVTGLFSEALHQTITSSENYTWFYFFTLQGVLVSVEKILFKIGYGKLSSLVRASVTFGILAYTFNKLLINEIHT